MTTIPFRSNRRRVGALALVAATVAALLSVAGTATAGAGTPPPKPGGQIAGFNEHRGAGGEVDVNVCSYAQDPGFAHCNARVRTDSGAQQLDPRQPGGVAPDVTPPSGSAYGPADLQSAYNTPSSTGGTGVTVAIVDAYDNPNAEADLAQYRAAYGLPPCTTANGCFRKVDQNGGTSYPAPNKGWAQEIALDLDMVSAICPRCKILLVEATNNSITNLGIAVNRAAAMGAVAISNSYGASEGAMGALVPQYADAYYNHPGVLVTVSSGDAGYGVEFPASAGSVLAVGGTRLTRSGGVFSETAWSGAGSGCSIYFSKPAWQKDISCAKRTVADVSAVADPSTGVFVYTTYGGDPGFMVFGGTSASSPIVAAVYALAGNPASLNAVNSYPYTNPAALHDVTSGSNGTCGGLYLCTAKPGYDGPTGLGTPNGIGAFTGAVAPDFTISASPSTLNVVQGSSATSTVTLGALGGYTGSVDLSATVSPATGVTASFSPSPVTLGASATSTLTLTADPAASGPFTVTVTGTGPGGKVHSTTVNVTAVKPDFSLAASPTALKVPSGGSATSSLSLGALFGFTGTVDLTVAVSPGTGLTAGFSPSSVSLGATATSILTLSAAPGASGPYTVTVTGTSGALVHTAVVNVTVGAPDFTLSVSPASIGAPRGVGGSFTVTITSLSGFTGPVQLKVTGQKPGDVVTYSVNPIPGGAGTATVKVKPSWADTPGLVPLVVTGTSGTLSHSAQVFMSIT